MDNELRLDDLFEQARTQPAVATFDDTKGRFLHSLEVGYTPSANKTIQVLIKNKWILMLVAISSITAIIIATTTWNTQPVNEQSTDHIQRDHIEATPESTSNVAVQYTEKSEEEPTIQHPEKVDALPVKPLDHQLQQDVHRMLELRQVKAPKQALASFEDRPYFPTLTEEEIKANHKQKKKMLKHAGTFDKKYYSYVPSGSYTYNGKEISVQAFYIQRTEVSNLEYRTFLFDLLIQGRKTEFLKAAPQQQCWEEVLGEDGKYMKDNYFSSEEFNDYPVNNITPEGAKMYCKWLSTEQRKLIKGAENNNDFRLPVRAEWVKAASVEGKFEPYPWGGPFARNAEGCYLANYKYNADDKQVACTDGSKNFPNAKSTAQFCVGGYNYTTKVDNFAENEHGLYNMAGNVDEMVYDDVNPYPDGAIATAGGGWMNSLNNIKVNSVNVEKGKVEAHPNVGFRVVSTHLNPLK